MMFKYRDSIHGEITLPKYIQEIILTKEFKRLGNIKQLGVSNYFFKEANHTRYEHSIGTAYMCLKILDIIERNSDVKIDENHKKCVVLAGLLHDLGHGPFSHLWEDVVRKGIYKNWTHEDQSVKMIHHMINKNDIKLHSDPIVHDRMIDLTCSFITGDFKVWRELLTPAEMFLTEIVSNKYCNIDVDKYDYILRDFFCVQRGLMPFEEFLDHARIVYDENDVSHIGYSIHDFHLIENLFVNRANYHMNVYQLTQVAGIEKQLKDICWLADSSGFKIVDMSLTEIQESCEKYCQLDDSVLELIRCDSNPKMKKAQELIKNLDKGRFYEIIYETKDTKDAADVLDMLTEACGDVFCTVEKFIPSANVPSNIPLYDDDGNNVQKTSNHRLDYKSTIIFCRSFDSDVYKNALNCLNNNDM